MTITLNPTQQALLKDIARAEGFVSEEEALTALLEHASENQRKLESMRALLREADDDPRPSRPWTPEERAASRQRAPAIVERGEAIPAHVRP